MMGYKGCIFFPSLTRNIIAVHLTSHRSLPGFSSTRRQPASLNMSTSASSCHRDANWDDENFHHYTDGRWLFNESKQLAARSVQFNMTELVRIAAASQGYDISSCIDARKLPEGSFNKAFLITFQGDKQVIAKVPNPNAGLPFYTTSSEVATMDFARNIAGLPVPKIYAWNVYPADNSVGAEYIIMDKANGVPLSSKWPNMHKKEKIQLIQNVVSMERSLLQHPFEKIGSIYYESDLVAANTKRSVPSGYSGFVVGPTTSRTFLEDGRRDIESDRGPRNTAYEYVLASARRERECITQLPLFRRPQGIFGGPGCYIPTAEAKIEVIDNFEKVARYLLPKDTSVHVPVLWHGDMHPENIFIDPDDPTNILSIIDWQTVSLGPLFQQVRTPGFLDYAGPKPAEGFTMPSLPEDFETLGPAEKTHARELQVQQTMYKTYEMFAARENPTIFNALRHSKTLGSEIISLVSQVFNDGEPIIKGQMIQLCREWDRVVGKNGPPCPLKDILTPASIAAQEADQEKWAEGVQMLEDVTEALGGAENGWDGWVSHEDYEQLRQKLGIVKEQFLNHVAGDDFTKRKAWEKVWPFQDN